MPVHHDTVSTPRSRDLVVLRLGPQLSVEHFGVDELDIELTGVISMRHASDGPTSPALASSPAPRRSSSGPCERDYDAPS